MVCARERHRCKFNTVMAAVSTPSSPPVEVPPIQLVDCMEELLKFTLLSSLQGKLWTGLSNEYCATLLRDDPSNTLSTNINVLKGVPVYPLYKHLALSLCHSILNGGLCVAYKELVSLHKDQSIKMKEGNDLDKLFLEKGSVLLNILKEVDFELHVQEPFFSLINDGLKTIEGRCAIGKYRRFQFGHLLLCNKCIILHVQDVRQYASFHDMLKAENLENVLPRVASIEEGIRVYRNFYSEEKERTNGVLAICIRVPSQQLYVVLASMLSELSYVGVQKLLGFVETTGTDPKLLPPPTSTLLSAFSMLHNPNVKSSALTTGARALAKHVSRSSQGYWGAIHGSDPDKNRQAVDVVCSLLTQCCWLNMHIVPPHGAVFEIRNDEGFGARWSADGTEFIGFLEPYGVDG